MQREARPDRLDVWCRKSLPDRPDPAFLLALDLSGSMRGSPIHWAFRGLVVLAEALERLQLPFEIWGFQDVPIPFKRLHEPLGVQRTILNALPLEVLGRRAGGHNRPEHNWDGPVLETLQHRLGQHRTPLLLVVSDGAPSGPTHAEARLRAAINNLSDHVRLVGIGLGPDAHHVADYYPRSVITALDTFPAAIAQCLEESLHGP
jgi:cobalamin biosynthesis protein CobT